MCTCSIKSGTKVPSRDNLETQVYTVSKGPMYLYSTWGSILGTASLIWESNPLGPFGCMGTWIPGFFFVGADVPCFFSEQLFITVA